MRSATWILGVFVILQRSFVSAHIISLRERLQRNAKAPPIPMKGVPLSVKAGMYIESLGKFQSTEMVITNYVSSSAPKSATTVTNHPSPFSTFTTGGEFPTGDDQVDDFEPMSFDVDLYLYLSWQDPSLNHTNDDYVLVNDPKVREHIWLPDLYFANARTSKFHEVTVPNFNLFIAQDGTIAYSSRITLNVACNLNLVHYPMDRQLCGIRTVSYAYIEKQVNVSWFRTTPSNAPIRYNPDIGLPEFNILQISPSYCDGTYLYAIMEKSYKIDKFSCLEANIYLRRSIGYHLVQSFIPTGLIVMISWVSFWIDRRAVPARVTLSFTTLLSLSTLGNGLRFGLPQVSYAKSIDFWFGSCMFFVFLSLVEFAAVNSYMRQSEKYEKMANSIEKQKSVIPDSPNNFSLGKNSLLLFNRQNETGGGVTAMMTKMSMEVSKSASSFNGSTNNSGVTVSASGSGRGVEFEEEADEKMDISVFSPLSVVKNCISDRFLRKRLAAQRANCFPTVNRQQPPNSGGILGCVGCSQNRQHHNGGIAATADCYRYSCCLFCNGNARHRLPQADHVDIVKNCQRCGCFYGAGDPPTNDDYDEFASVTATDSILCNSTASTFCNESNTRKNVTHFVEFHCVPTNAVICQHCGGDVGAAPPPTNMKPLLLDDNDGDEETTTEARRVEGEKEIIEKLSFSSPKDPPLRQRSGGRRNQPPVIVYRQHAGRTKKREWPTTANDNEGGGENGFGGAGGRSTAVGGRNTWKRDPDVYNPAQTNYYIQLGFLYSSKGLLIDKWSRVMFPLLFILFNIVYWLYYLWYIQESL